MNAQEGITAMYYLLNKYYLDCGLGRKTSSFGLTPFLSFLTPEPGMKTWDPAYWEVWLETLEKGKIPKNMNTNDLIKAMRLFIQKYQDDFGFNFDEIPEKLNSLSQDDICLSEAIEDARALLISDEFTTK